ncbi:hypothetical protein EOPP23_01290 [Endozoicomonas sp. OPT23]|uniref:protein kinase domain-containing protein n=1 Tax=Endozoicomonas sp. OPT23 TaxID=2072845 RepID=UPI00129AD6DA|nr:protein kinase [Endozoicomonas sp. OPT23]MRI31627.1 hypothetical protein [Endozoicomonas sp. OPT23]
MPKISQQGPISQNNQPARLNILQKIIRYLGRLVRTHKSHKRYVSPDSSAIQSLSKKNKPEWVIGTGGSVKAVVVTRGNHYFVSRRKKSDTDSEFNNEFSAARKKIQRLRNQKSFSAGHLGELQKKIDTARVSLNSPSLEPPSPALLAFFSELDACLEPFYATQTVSLKDIDALRALVNKSQTEPKLESLCWSIDSWLNGHEEAFSTHWKSMDAADSALNELSHKLSTLAANEVSLAEKITALDSEVLINSEATEEGLLSPLAGEPIGKLLAEPYSETPKPLPKHHLQNILKSIGTGLCELHNAGLNHMDLNFGNILVDGLGRVKIIDFGLCCTNEQLFSSPRKDPPSKAETLALQITPGVLLSPPERFSITGERPGSADMWAFGLHFTSLLTGKKLHFSSASNAIRLARSGTEMSDAIQQHVGEHCIEAIASAYGDESIEVNLARRLFDPDPEKRITSRDLLEHPYFSDSTTSTPSVNPDG